MSKRILRAVALFAAAIVLFAAAPAATDAVVVPTITAIAAGFSHTCALTSAGGVRCWGQNGSGQLGNGTTTSSNVPVAVSGLASGVTAIAAGGVHTCALMSGGGVRCWGKNSYGQLGSGSTTNSSVPVAVSGLASGVAAIVAGYEQTCALRISGGVACWGANYNGQLGNGSTTNSSVPVAVSGLASGVSAITLGFRHGCALAPGGGPKCWGSNYGGQLGNGTTTDSSTPVAVSGLARGATAIVAGLYQTCALMTGGGVRCWGNDPDQGELGNGLLTTSRVPVEVAGLERGVAAVVIGAFHVCVLTTGGGVTCWGSNESYGQLGSGTTTDSSVPLVVSGLASGISAIAAGVVHTCAVTSGGGVRCWGGNFHGQLGDGTRTTSKVPVAVNFVTRQSIVLRASEPAGTIASGTAVTFSATVAPLGPAGEQATVRFEVFRQDGGVWRRTAHRDVAADATGRATLRWTFVTIGSRYVRARALETATYVASPWSSRVDFTVRWALIASPSPAPVWAVAGHVDETAFASVHRNKWPRWESHHHVRASAP